MLAFDIAMPLALFAVTAAALLLNKRVEGKLKTTFEEREFRTRDVILLVVMVAVTVSVIAYTSLLNPGQVFPNILLIVFLSSYSVLLFTFSHIFSNMQKRKAQFFSLGFAIVSLIAGTISFLNPFTDGLMLYRAGAFFGLAIFSFCALIVAQKKTGTKDRWYVAVQPPALFILLFIFYNLLYSGGVQVWYPLLMDVFGITFAILIVLYLGSMFTWKTAFLFAILLTIMDIILVLGTGTMVAAAQQFTGLGLPVLVYLPKIPLIPIPPDYPFIHFFGFLPSGLGLGDFFFAGILAIQTLKKFGKKTTWISVVAMVVSFGAFLAFMPEIITRLEPLIGREIGGFPGTLMIICGWLPVVAWKMLSERKRQQQSQAKLN
jgi:hypothetical protein